MIKNRRIGHIGIATNDVARDVEWYVNVLGFEVTGKFQNGNDTVYFLKNDDVIFEIFPSDSRLPDEVSGRIDHYSFASDDIESDYHGYGSMMFLEDGRLIVYNYNLDDEYNLSYVLSEDKGMSWGQAGTTFVAKKIRNPQVVGFEHLYFLHGRSGNNGEQAGNFVLYCSEDGIHWDEGRYLKVRTEGLGAYSNNLVIGKGTSHEKLLIQASHAYKDNQTNVLHWQIIKRKV